MESGILIAYYTWSGNTEHIARLIQQKSGGDLFTIKPEKEYPGSYGVCVRQAKKEIHDGFMPELTALPDTLNQYETVFVGSPIWWYTMAPPVLTFLSRSKLADKNILPFCTHGGGGEGHFTEDVRKSCPGSSVRDGLILYGSGGSRAEAEVSAWLKRTGIDWDGER